MRTFWSKDIIVGDFRLGETNVKTANVRKAAGTYYVIIGLLNFLKRHPTTSYFLVAYVIGWSGILWSIGQSWFGILPGKCL